MKKLLIFLLAVFFCLSVLLYTGCGDKTIVECEDQTDLVTRGGIGITLRTDGVEGDTGIFLGKNPDDILIGAFSESGATHGFISAGSPGYPGLFSIGKINEVNFSQASFSPSLTYNSETGNIGIGTTNPSVCFEVTCAKDIGNSTFVSARLGNGNDHWTYFGDGNSGRIRGSGEGYLYLSSNPNGSGDKDIYLNANGYSVNVEGGIIVDSNITLPHGNWLNLWTSQNLGGIHWDDNVDAGFIMYQDGTSDITDGALILDGMGGANIFAITDCYVGINTTNPNYLLDVRGTIGNNTTQYHSDKRWKKNITTITEGLDKILRLRGVDFFWRGEEFPEMDFPRGKHFGLIAQEVEKVIPELVSTASDGYKSVEYANLVAVLIEAIKEQQNIINGQISKLEQQSTEIEEIRAELEALKHTTGYGSL